MRELVVARHAESEAGARQLMNGDPSVAFGLTERGRRQAEALGRAVGRVDLAAHTEFDRTRETAALAWPAAPTLVVPELNEITFGRFEGTAWEDGYGTWVATAGPQEDCPGGGESRVAALRRYLRGFRLLLARPEERIALIAHGAQVRYLLLAREGKSPTPVLEGIPLAEPYVLAREELAAAIGLLEEWAASPVF
jgi:broad specificity phosphatase PhoE